MKRIFCILLLLLPFTLSYAEQAETREEIQERIKPMGSVTVDSKAETKPAPQAEEKKPATAANESETGQSVYERHCIICHRDGVAGAPKFKDEATWKPHLEGREMNDLIATVIKGKNAMPPKGTCQECSDSDIKAAIQYMIPKK